MKKLFFSALIIIALAALLFFTVLVKEKLPSNVADDSFSPKTVSVNKEVFDYFTEIALGHELGEEKKPGYRNLTKWAKPKVSIKLNDPLNETLETCLNSVISDFNKISNTTQLSIDSENDIDFYLRPVEEFPKILPEYVPGNDGFFWINVNDDNSISSSIVLINSNDPSRDLERCHLIREELTQSMGLAQDSYKYQDSIFYAPWSITQTYSEIDKELIKLLYSSGLRSNMSPSELEQYFIVN